MAETYSICVAGLNSPEEAFVCGHFSRAGHQVFAAKDVVDAKEKAGAREAWLCFFQAAEDRAVEAVHQLSLYGLTA